MSKDPMFQEYQHQLSKNFERQLDIALKEQNPEGKENQTKLDDIPNANKRIEDWLVHAQGCLEFSYPENEFHFIADHVIFCRGKSVHPPFYQQIL